MCCFVRWLFILSFFSNCKITAAVSFLGLLVTFDNMASMGLRAISYQVTRKVEAGYKPTHTTETHIGYIVC
jgi:hypothetical protein